MTIKLSVALFVSILACGVFAAQGDNGGGGGNQQSPQDQSLAANRAVAEARVADPADANKRLSKADQQKLNAQKKADLAEYKGMVKDNLASVKAMFQAAEQAWKAKNYKQAGAFYLSVTQATVPGAEEMVEISNQRINADMEKLAKDHLAAADDDGLIKDYMKEIDELSIVLNDFGITAAKKDAFSRLSNLKTKPEVAGYVELTQAEQLLADNKLTEAMTMFTAIANNSRYEHTIPALKSQRHLDELNKNEETRARLKTEFIAKADKEAPQLMSLAKNFATNNMPMKAREKLSMVIDKFPGTTYAEDAKKQLDELPTK